MTMSTKGYLDGLIKLLRARAADFADGHYEQVEIGQRKMLDGVPMLLDFDVVRDV